MRVTKAQSFQLIIITIITFIIIITIIIIIHVTVIHVTIIFILIVGVIRCGLEGALLTALSHFHGIPLSHLLHPHMARAPPQRPPSGGAEPAAGVLVNGLLDCSGGDMATCRQEALALVAQGYTALKVKVSLVLRLGTSGVQRCLAVQDPCCVAWSSQLLFV